MAGRYNRVINSFSNFRIFTYTLENSNDIRTGTSQQLNIRFMWYCMKWNIYRNLKDDDIMWNAMLSMLINVKIKVLVRLIFTQGLASIHCFMEFNYH